MWAAVLLAGVGCYLLKLAGLSVPDRVLEKPFVRRLSAFIPVALLAAMIAVQTFSTEQALVVDARLGGLLFAIAAFALKAPFLVAVFGAAVVTALLRLGGIG